MTDPLNLLRETEPEVPEVDESFDRRVLRRWQVESVSAGARYWMPALVGVAIGAVVILAGLRMVSGPGPIPIGKPIGEARRDLPAFPDLSRTP